MEIPTAGKIRGFYMRVFFAFFALGDENNMKEAKINPNSYVNFFVYLLLSVDFDVLLYTHFSTDLFRLNE